MKCEGEEVRALWRGGGEDSQSPEPSLFSSLELIVNCDDDELTDSDAISQLNRVPSHHFARLLPTTSPKKCSPTVRPRRRIVLNSLFRKILPAIR